MIVHRVPNVHRALEMLWVSIKSVERLERKHTRKGIGIGSEGDTFGKIGEVDEVGERELVLVVSVRCDKE